MEPAVRSTLRLDWAILPARELPLMFVHPDFADTRVLVTPQRENPPFDEYVLRSGGVVEGTVYLDGKPCGTARVDWWNEATNPGYGIGGAVANDGHFRLNRLEPGDATLKVTIFSIDEARMQKLRRSLTVAAGRTLIQNFHFSSAAVPGRD